jgi:hypothetical protein
MLKEQQKLRFIGNINFLKFLLILNLIFMKVNSLSNPVTQFTDQQFKSLNDLSIPLNQIADISHLIKTKIFAVKEFQMNLVENFILAEIP